MRDRPLVGRRIATDKERRPDENERGVASLFSVELKILLTNVKWQGWSFVEIPLLKISGE